MSQLMAIWRTEKLFPHLSRNTSFIFRMDNLLLAIPLSFFSRSFNGSQLNYPASILLRQGVADLVRNSRPISNGTGGRFETESVADLARNTHFLQAIRP